MKEESWRFADLRGICELSSVKEGIVAQLSVMLAENESGEQPASHRRRLGGCRKQGKADESAPYTCGVPVDLGVESRW
jgi:hypothetical protein